MIVFGSGHGPVGCIANGHAYIQFSIICFCQDPMMFSTHCSKWARLVIRINDFGGAWDLVFFLQVPNLLSVNEHCEPSTATRT